MDRKTLGILILSVTAAVLFAAQFIPQQPAHAASTIRERDYSLVTGRLPSGSDALYITDNRTGLIAVFTWDNTRRMLALRDVRRVEETFTP